MKYTIRALTLGEVLDHALKILQNHFKLLMGIAAMLFLPVLLVFSIIGAFMQSAMQQQVAAHGDGQPPNPAELGDAMVPLLIVFCVAMLIYVVVVVPLTNASITHAISSEYLGQPVTAGEAFRVARSRFGALIWTSFLNGLWVGLGLIAFVIPGIYLAFRYCLSTQVVVIENKSGSEALRRSGELMKGNMGAVFVLGLLIGVISILAGSCRNFLPGLMLQGIANSFIQAIVSIFSLAAMAVFYFSCRCKAENFDLQVLVENMGAVPQPGLESAPRA